MKPLGNHFRKWLNIPPQKSRKLHGSASQKVVRVNTLNLICDTKAKSSSLNWMFAKTATGNQSTDVITGHLRKMTSAEAEGLFATARNQGNNLIDNPAVH
jgi:hypothetical protein